MDKETFIIKINYNLKESGKKIRKMEKELNIADLDYKKTNYLV